MKKFNKTEELIKQYKSYTSISGITLIALIITIIVLLILAGITISQLTDNGLITKTVLSKKISRYTSAKELIDLKLMEIQTSCIQDEKEYTISEIARCIKEDKEITIEKYYNSNIASIKTGITENLKNLEGIVVSVDEYSEYKFLLGKSCKIEGIIEENITDETNKEKFKTLEQFEKDEFGNTLTKKDSDTISYKENLIDYWSLKNGLNNNIKTSSTGDLVLYRQQLPTNYSEENGAKFNNTVLKTKNTYVFPEKFALTMKIKIDEDYNLSNSDRAYIFTQSTSSYANHNGYTGLWMAPSKLLIENGIYNSMNQLYTSADILEKNTWITIVYQYDGTNLQVYINGKNVTDGDYKKTGFKNVSSPLYIGGTYYVGTYTAGVNWKYLNGYYKDIAIYNRTFSEQEIENFNN